MLRCQNLAGDPSLNVQPDLRQPKQPGQEGLWLPGSWMLMFWDTLCLICPICWSSRELDDLPLGLYPACQSLRLHFTRSSP